MSQSTRSAHEVTCSCLDTPPPTEFPGLPRGGDGTERHQKYNSAGETFVEILRDAHTLTRFFSKLLAFQAQWHPEPAFYGFSEEPGQICRIARLFREGVDGEGIVALWLKVMREWLRGENVAPLACVRFSLEGSAADGYGHELGILTNKAYGALVKEQQTEEDIEDSRRMWLEEMGKQKTTGKKDKKRQRVQGAT